MQDRSKLRWLSLWRRIQAKGDALTQYNNLVTRYSEPHRAYHILPHIMDGLNLLEEIQHFVRNPDVMEWAYWHHDAVYDTHAHDNEEKSAELAEVARKDAGLPESWGQIATSLIMATKHSVVPANTDAQFLVDIDLSILGQAEEKFDAYERAIRKEYGWVPESDFIAGRSNVLRHFLNRPNIYSTDFFRKKYEARARQNIARSLEQLSHRS